LLDHLRSLQTMIQDGAHADETWDAILVVFDRIKSGAEVHRRMLIDAGEMVERSRVLMLIDRLSTDMIAVINEMEVADEQKREARIRVSNLVGTYLNRASLPPSRNAPTPD
ncbi:MAG TPA: hypothetical protein VFX21_02720, partial [Acidimicrobiia bacterium]|nr:hypothetical protein [Acidimicrobiia bacterium]